MEINNHSANNNKISLIFPVRVDELDRVVINVSVWSICLSFALVCGVELRVVTVF